MQEQKSKKLTAKDVPVPEFPKMEFVKEDFFGSIFGEESERSFQIQTIFSLLVFGVGLAVGLAIGGSAL